MSLLPYHKGNKTKFTNLLFPLIRIMDIALQTMHKKKFRLPITGKPESITLLLTTKLTAKIICKSRAKRKITANIYSKIHDFPKNQTERS